MPTQRALGVVAAITLLRIVIAWHAPLSEDEAYYWSWSLHPAFGYVDHPPGVMFLILAFSWLGHSPLAIRIGFILAEAFAALFAGGAARQLSGSIRAGTYAAIIFALLPQLRLFAGEALPDGPFLLCWTAALYTASRFFAHRRRSDAVWLGIALAGALLSRFFGWALFFGIVAYALAPSRRPVWKAGLWIACTIAIACYLPFLAWNASHGWANIVFTAYGRQGMHGVWPPAITISSLRCMVYALIIVGLTYVVAIRPGYALITWTVLPFAALLVSLSFFETVESYWLLGPAASLIVATGIACADLGTTWRRALGGAYALPVALAIAAAAFPALPQSAQTWLLRSIPPTRALYSPTAGFEQIAQSTAALARTHTAAIVTDRYEVAAELLYNGVDVSMTGNGLGAKQWGMWEKNQPIPATVLFVRDLPIGNEDALRKYAQENWSTVVEVPTLQAQYDGLQATRLFAIIASRPKTPIAALPR